MKTPIIPPIIGPIYGIKLIRPAKNPMRIAYCTPKNDRPVLTIMVMAAICIIIPMKYRLNNSLVFFKMLLIFSCLSSGVKAVITLLAKYFFFNKKKVINSIEKSAIRPFPNIPKIELKSVPTLVKLKMLSNSSSKLFSDSLGDCCVASFDNR